MDALANPIARAAEMLREAAADLKLCHTVGVSDDWTGEDDAKAAHDEYLSVASAIEAAGLLPSSEGAAELASIYDAFGIGSAARNIHILKVNLGNVLRRERCLAAIERTFFMVPTEPEEEDDGEPGEECLLNWGQDPDEYVRTFREALKTLSAMPAESVYLVATGETHEGQETYTRHDARPPLCDAETLYTAPGASIAAREQGDVEIPEGWVPLVIAYEPGYPEEVAFGPKIMMDRLKKWLDRYFALRTASRLEAPVASGETGDKPRGPRIEHLCRAICAHINVDPDQVLDYTDGKPSKLAWHRHDLQAARLLRELDALASPSGAGLGGAVASSEAVERAAFETWFCEDGNYEAGWLDGRSTSAGWSYSNAETENMWQTWKARAALASQPGCAVEGEAVAAEPDDTPLETGEGDAR